MVLGRVDNTDGTLLCKLLETHTIPEGRGHISLRQLSPIVMVIRVHLRVRVLELVAATTAGPTTKRLSS